MNPPSRTSRRTVVLARPAHPEEYWQRPLPRPRPANLFETIYERRRSLATNGRIADTPAPKPRDGWGRLTSLALSS